MSSLATFFVGIFAVRELETEPLAAYALLFSAFLVAGQLSTELVLIPSQIIALDAHPLGRLGMIRHSLPRGAKLSAVGALAVPLGALPLVGEVERTDLVLLAASACALAVVSPLQDHLRAMFHLADQSWVSAGIALAHLSATAVGLLVLGSRAPLLAPFGALVLGNTLSIFVAAVAFFRIKPEHSPQPTSKQLSSLGVWLLATGVSKTGLAYASRALVTAVLGTAALGFVEGARVVAQPINVLAMGLIAQVGPRSTAASSKGNRQVAKHWRKRFVQLLAIVALPYIALTSVPWDLNPFFTLAPRAYAISGLTAATLLVALIGCVLRPLRAELLGARLQRIVARVTIAAGAVEIAFIGLGGTIFGAYAVPMGLGAGSIIGIYFFNRTMQNFYESQRLPASSRH